MRKYVLFDLDGTLTDPKEGITKSVSYALKAYGIDEPDLDKLEPFIGPPLKNSFMEFYGFNETKAEEAVLKYRERFSDVGKFENEIYDGVAVMLKRLKSHGFHLAVASSKPQPFVEEILEHFHIAEYFEVVVGSGLDGSLSTKEEVVHLALNQLFHYRPIKNDEVYMVGDRRFDVEGAKFAGVEAVAVAYGYGSLEELKAAKADYIVMTVQELSDFLMREADENAEKPVLDKHTPTQRIMLIGIPFLMFLVIRTLAVYMCLNFAKVIATYISEKTFDKWFPLSEDGAFYPTANVLIICTALAYLIAGIVTYPKAKKAIVKTAENERLQHLKKDSVWMYISTFATMIFGALGLNMLISLAGITSASNASLAEASITAGIIYCLFPPISEELLFRGIVYNYCKKFIPNNKKIAMFITAFIFAMYHSDSIQSIYSFIFGLLFVYAYEYFGSFWVPVAMHLSHNLIVYLVCTLVPENSGFFSLPVAISFMVVSVVSFIILVRSKKTC